MSDMYGTTPVEYGTPIPPLEEPPKKSNTTIIIVVVVLVLLCCCCIAFFLIMYFWLGDILMNSLNLGWAPLLMMI
jgi:hypothetical protein